ncbi:MAG: DNRLRE domain-containing protein, partial [Syntrophomonas sp.]
MKKSTLFILSLMFMFLSQLLWNNTEAYAYDLSITASMDKFVDITGGYDYSNPGDGNQIYVGYDYGDTVTDYGSARAAIQFELGTIDTSRTIQSANLKIYLTTVENLGSLGPPFVTLYSSDTDGWLETDSSLPTQGTAIVSNDYGLTANSWKSFSVTDFIAAQAAGDGKASFLLTGVETGISGDRSQFCFDDKTVASYSACLEITYVPNSPPTVTTQAVSAITASTATGNGTITNLGVPNPTAHGVCWNTSGNPTTADS